MPTYQYACTECEHRFEQFQAFSDASLTDCPVCAGRLRKVYGSVGVVFKGSGFYRTDSRAGAAAPAGEKSEKSEKSESAASTSADSGKTAAKESSSPAAKSVDAGSSSSSSSGNGSSTNGSATPKPGKAGKPAAAAKSSG